MNKIALYKTRKSTLYACPPLILMLRLAQQRDANCRMQAYRAGLVLAGILAALCGFMIHAGPSFDCKKATTKVEKAICGNEHFGDLDGALSVVYKKALELSHNDPKLRAAQQEWMLKRDQDDSSLEFLYESRILELLKDHVVRDFFLDEFLKNPSKIDRIIACLANVSLLEVTDTFWYNSKDRVSETFFFIPMVSRSKILVAVGGRPGPYHEEYSFFILSQSDGQLIPNPKSNPTYPPTVRPELVEGFERANTNLYRGFGINLTPFLLPQAKTFSLPMENNSLAGSFTFREKDGQNFIDYAVRPSTEEIGNSCTWLIDEGGARLVDEQQRDRDLSLLPIFDKKVLIGAWEEIENSQGECCQEEGYNEQTLEFMYKDGDVYCTGNALTKLPNRYTYSMHVGEINGFVGIKQTKDSGEKPRNSHLFVQEECSDSPKNAIRIEIIHKDRIKVCEYKGAVLGGSRYKI